MTARQCRKRRRRTLPSCPALVAALAAALAAAPDAGGGAGCDVGASYVANDRFGDDVVGGDDGDDDGVVGVATDDYVEAGDD